MPIWVRVTELARGDVIRRDAAATSLWHVLTAYEVADSERDHVVVVRMRREVDDAYATERWSVNHRVLLDCRSSLLHGRTPDLGDVVRYRACSMTETDRAIYHDVEAVVIGRWHDPRAARLMVKVRPRGFAYVDGRQRIVSELVKGEPVMPMSEVAIVATALADAGDRLI